MLYHKLKPPLPTKSVIVRAFELARSGDFAKLGDLERKLSTEGYPASDRQLMAPTLRKQLRTACRAAADERAGLRV